MVMFASECIKANAHHQWPSKIETVIHHYDYYRQEDYDEAEAFIERMQSSHGKFLMHSWGGPEKVDYPPEGTCVLLTEHIYDNQWSGETARLFDWYRQYQMQTRRINGHWLEQTEEMQLIRQCTYGCGFCGNQVKVSPSFVLDSQLWCDQCMGSEYLEEEQLHLLLMMPMSIRPLNRKRIDMPDEVYDRYESIALAEKKERSVKKINRIREQLRKEKEHLDRKTAGYLFFLEHLFDTDNLIYYPHTGKFVYGWRKPVPRHVRDSILATFDGKFPGDLEFKLTAT